MPAFWVGIDSGKKAHHCVVIDQAGTVLLSKRVENDENALLELMATIAEIGGGSEVCWATDLNAGGAALLIELLAAHAQQLLYIPGRIVHHAAATYRGDGKTDAKDARIIADQARMRTDLQPVRGADQISVDLRLLTARRTDLICDRVRAINRLRATLLEYFPALERAFDYSKKGAPDPPRRLPDPRGHPADRADPALRLAEETRLPEQCQDGRESAHSRELPAHRPANSDHRLRPCRPAGRANQHSRCRDRRRRCPDHRAVPPARRPPMFCSPCRGSAPYLQQLSSRTSAATWTRSTPSTGSPASRAWLPSRAIPDESAGTFTDHVDSTAGSCEPVTSPPSPA